MNSSNSDLDLNDYLSIDRIRDREIIFLNLNRCLRQPVTIIDITENELISGISLMHNYLINMPNFVSNYMNLIEFNASYNALNDMDFLINRSRDNNELHGLYWNVEPKMNLRTSVDWFV